jgi:voltage-gated potassium channel
MFFFFSRRFRQRWSSYRRLLAPVDMRRSLLRSGIYLGAIIAFHTLAMIEFEGMAFGDAVWLTLTTMTTVGYGDRVAETFWGRASTVFLIYVGGIFVLFHTAADYFEYRSERKALMIKGLWRWKMRNHVLIMGGPNINQEQFLFRLVTDLHESEEFCDCPVEKLTIRFPDGLPPSLQRLGLILHAGYPNDPDDIAATDVDKAAAIIVLAHQEDDMRSDARTFDRVSLARELGAKGRMLAECVKDGNRPRMKKAGADIVVRPIRFYPEILVRALTSPGSSEILENIFTSHGDVCVRVEVLTKGLRWADISRGIMEANMGTAIGYEDAGDGTIQCNPPPEARIDASALHVIARQGNFPSASKAAAVLEQLRK